MRSLDPKKVMDGEVGSDSSELQTAQLEEGEASNVESHELNSNFVETENWNQVGEEQLLTGEKFINSSKRKMPVQASRVHQVQPSRQT